MTITKAPTTDKDSRRRKWPRWILAERQVAEILNRLPMDKFIVMNDVKFRYGNVDHMLIRDDGALFLIETKSHIGSVTFDGKELLINGRYSSRNYLCQMNRNIRWLRQFMRRMWRTNPWFVAILIFPNATVGISRSVKRVNVLEAKDLSGFVTSYSAG